MIVSIDKDRRQQKNNNANEKKHVFFRERRQHDRHQYPNITDESSSPFFCRPRRNLVEDSLGPVDVGVVLAKEFCPYGRPKK